MTTPGREPESELDQFASSLRRIRPAPVALNRDRILFEAGREQGRAEVSRRFRWSLVASIALVGSGLGLLLIRERTLRNDLEVRIAAILSEPARQPKTPTAPTELAEPVRAAPDSYLTLTRHLLSGAADPAPSGQPLLPSTTLTDEPKPLQVRGSSGLIDL